MQVTGHDRGLVLMEKADPLLLLVSLPLVPLGLVLGKMVRWQEPLLQVYRDNVDFDVHYKRQHCAGFAGISSSPAADKIRPPCLL